jgi:hypothetical protein
MPSIKLGEAAAEIIDPDGLLPVYADLITELRMLDGVLHISLATLVIEGFGSGATHTARVCARLRIPPSTLQAIQNALAAPHEEAPPPGQAIN